MAKKFEYHVEMTCEGCVGAVKRILDRHIGKGVDTYEVDLPMKLVTIRGTLEEEAMTEVIGKCGKDVILKSVQED